MPLKKYQNNSFYNIRERYCSSVFVVSKDTWLWIGKTKEPVSINVSCESLSLEDEVITITTDRDCTLFQFDVLPFSNSVVVIDETKTITANTPTNLNILPSQVEITELSETCTFALIPVMSVASGGSLEFTSNEAEALNKVQMFPARATISRTAESKIEGRLIKNDESIDFLYTLNLRSRTIYCEIRYSPFIEDRGMGLGAWSFEATTSISANWEQDDFVKCTASFILSGRPSPYNILACSSNIIVEPEPELTIDYCPIDVTGLNAFSLGTSGEIMRLTIDTNNGAGTDYGFTFPPSSVQDFTIDWGDSNTTVVTNAPANGVIEHIYASDGIYTITITGTSCQGIQFENVTTFNDHREKLTQIISWDDSKFTIELTDNIFSNAANLISVPSNYTVISGHYLTGWFDFCPFFVGDVSSWDVSNATSLQITFSNCAAFNQNLNGWDISNCTDIGGIFSEATTFDQPLNNWNTSNITRMDNVFSGASQFNQNINSWDVSNVTTMSRMFSSAVLFNQPLNTWNTINVTNMARMFLGASSFNQDISNFNVTNVTSMQDMLTNSNLSVTNYSNFLISCASQSVQTGVLLGATGLQYNAAGQTARNTLTGTYGWVITDDGLAP